MTRRTAARHTGRTTGHLPKGSAGSTGSAGSGDGERVVRCGTSRVGVNDSGGGRPAGWGEVGLESDFCFIFPKGERLVCEPCPAPPGHFHMDVSLCAPDRAKRRQGAWRPAARGRLIRIGTSLRA